MATCLAGLTDQQWQVLFEVKVQFAVTVQFEVKDQSEVKVHARNVDLDQEAVLFQTEHF